MNKYIISGPGRCAGHYLLGIIKSTGVQAVRTHDPAYTFNDDSDTVLIIIDRQDRFAAIMSNSLVWHTGQSTHYEVDSIEPFNLDLQKFILIANAHFNHYKNYDLTRPYAKIETFYYEDFVNNPTYILEKLKLTQIDLDDNEEILRLTHTPAPYNYKDIVINYKELEEYYNQHFRSKHVNNN